MQDYNTFRYTDCVVCGSRFKDDCGDSFCSSSCERDYEREHAKCEECDEEVGWDNLTQGGKCEDCEYREEE